ncbi:MAG: ferritin family protein [Anaerolineae bacterium]|nr:ferritin family protein [Anaerolineae bacterium]
MNIEPNLTFLEILGLAIKSEVNAFQVYERLAQRVQNPALRDKLLFLKGEEEKHRTILEAMHAQNFPEVQLELPPRSPLPRVEIALHEDTPVLELLDIALEWEKLSEEFYADFARRAQDAKGKAILQYLSEMESGHYHLLKAERDLLAQFPEGYNAGEYHLGEEMLHLGP